jgi:DNA repair exonuclease SbcCD ATPase subunit
MLYKECNALKINKLKVNGFGKLQDKEINLQDNINIIYGENEAGKSSLLTFIYCILYGASKNKNGKEISNFDKYKPWNTENFSGKIKYTLDNGKEYEVFRDFKKKSPTIYDSNQQDITKEFTVEKGKDINFFTEQTGIEEETFLNTAISEQEGVRLNQNNQNSIVQKISNLISTGDDNVSYKKTLDKLSKNQTERIGTERTSQRPLNKVVSRIDKLLARKEELEIIREKVQSGIDDTLNIEKDLTVAENQERLLKKLKGNLENYRVKTAEINVNKNLEKEYQEKIEYLNGKIDENAESSVTSKKSNLKLYYILLAISVIVCILMFVFVKNIFFDCAILLLPMIFAGIIIGKILKSKREKSNKLKELAEIRENISKEIKILEETKNKKSIEYKEKLEALNKEIESQKQDLKNEYMQILNAMYVLKAMDFSYDDVLLELENIEDEIKQKEFKLHTIKSDAENLNSQLEELTQIEEELGNREEEKDELLKLNSSFEVAKECLEKAYNEVKQNISPKFTENLSNSIKSISKGKYTKIKLNDEKGLTAEVESGEYFPVNRLSTGTIDQMYLSLRLSASQEVSNEKMPIILDEAFAYFDNERLQNILKYIAENYQERQVLIFTCSNREKETLNNLNLEYNLIKL